MQRIIKYLFLFIILGTITPNFKCNKSLEEISMDKIFLDKNINF